jgi:hypothetical protein
VGLDESFEHRRDLVLEGKAVFSDDPGGQALEARELGSGEVKNVFFVS